MPAIASTGTRLFKGEDGTVIIVPPGVDFKTELEEIHNVRSADIHLHIDDVVSADIDFMVNLPTPFCVVPKYYLTDLHPQKHLSPIKRVEYEDGEIWEPERREVPDGSESNSGGS